MSLESEAKLYGLTIKNGSVSAKGQTGGTVVGARASVQTAGDIESRITATRLVTLGVFAFAAKKKKDNRQLYLYVEGADGWQIVVNADPKQEPKVRKWAAAFNTAAATH